MVDAHLVRWKTDSLSQRAPHGTVPSPILFNLYIPDFQYNTELCYIQKYSIDILIDGIIWGGWEEEYRSLVEDFAMWCRSNHLQMNTYKTKEMAVDFRCKKKKKKKHAYNLASIDGVDVELVPMYTYLGLQLDVRLD